VSLTVDGVLGPRGALSAALRSYEHRPQQLALARAVADAFEQGHHLVSEAGTGTGKTLAYLVPAVLSGRRVIVSTATRTLQEQIFFKDIPLLRDEVGLEFTAALLKGRANYLCAHRFEQFDARPLFSSPEDATHWPRFRDWAHQTQSGDRSETELPDAWGTWHQVSTTSDSCLGGKCPLYESCFVTRARRTAEACQLVVVNHALFFADLALRARGGEKELRVLPPYDAVVFDEAHALEDVATEHFGLTVAWGRLSALSQDAMKAVAPLDPRAGTVTALALELKTHADRFFPDAAVVMQLSEGTDARLSGGGLAELRPLAVPLLDTLGALAALCPEDDEDLGGLHRRAVETHAALELILRADDPGQVYWAQARGRSVMLRAAPIDIGQSLARHLYGTVDSVVFTSATLAVNRSHPSPRTRGEGRGEGSVSSRAQREPGTTQPLTLTLSPSPGRGDFGFVATRFGLDAQPWEGLRVGSPFDYATQAALYIPPHLPEPSSPEWTRAFGREVYQLVRLTGGRAFVLFTSLKQMDAVHELLRPHLTLPMLKQGEQPRRALLEAFQAQPSVLFASQSFWEGVDVPGEALSLVIIDKLPFAPPDEPLNAARCEALRERGGRPFDEHQVPHAALALRQGFGRLIRTKSDFGVVALLDSRLTRRRYGRAFLKSLPPARRFGALGELAQWWEAGSTDLGATRGPG